MTRIAVFRRDREIRQALNFLQRAPCGGKTPRHFKIAPGGKWLLCAHQDSHTIACSRSIRRPANSADATPRCLAQSDLPPVRTLKGGWTFLSTSFHPPLIGF